MNAVFIVFVYRFRRTERGNELDDGKECLRVNSNLTARGAGGVNLRREEEWMNWTIEGQQQKKGDDFVGSRHRGNLMSRFREVAYAVGSVVPVTLNTRIERTQSEHFAIIIGDATNGQDFSFRTASRKWFSFSGDNNINNYRIVRR